MSDVHRWYYNYPLLPFITIRHRSPLSSSSCIFHPQRGFSVYIGLFLVCVTLVSISIVYAWYTQEIHLLCHSLNSCLRVFLVHRPWCFVSWFNRVLSALGALIFTQLSMKSAAHTWVVLVWSFFCLLKSLLSRAPFVCVWQHFRRDAYLWFVRYRCLFPHALLHVSHRSLLLFLHEIYRQSLKEKCYIATHTDLYFHSEIKLFADKLG